MGICDEHMRKFGQKFVHFQCMGNAKGNKMVGTYGYCFKDVLFRRFLDFTADQQLVQDEIGFFKVEDDVQFADLEGN
jgi:hypothetical protein